MQMTVSIYILGLAAGQLIYGPLSDRFGRRPALIGGLAIYTLAGLGTVLASFSREGADWLIAARLFQALGGCAGIVLGRAIVRDTASGPAVARRMAYLNMILTVVPPLAPLLGGLIAAGLGWRAVLAGLALLGLVNLALAWRRLPETRPRAASGNARQLARDYARLLASRRFMGYALGGGCATTSMYAFAASAPFIFVQQFHRPEHEAGLYLAALMSGVWLGSARARRLVERVALTRIAMGGNLVSLACGALILLLALAGHASMARILALMFLFTIGAGLCAPVALTLATDVNPAIAGSAAGLYGGVQMSVGALCTALAGLGGASLISTMIVLTLACVFSQAVFYMARHAP
jgi:DHA1 family bicyclomycin/chloramphenicol resistance-like MFS transporter